MYLKELKIKNFRSYEDVSFSFPKPTEDKNIVLIGAQNGGGKTSFLRALTICLTGIRGFRFNETLSSDSEFKQNYDRIRQSLLYKQAPKNTTTSIKAVFGQPSGNFLAITRRWFFYENEKEVEEEISIEKLGSEGEIQAYTLGKGEISAEDELDLLLRDYGIHWESVSAFFFDGESAEGRILGKKSGQTGNYALDVLYGFHVFDYLKAKLISYIQSNVKQINFDTSSSNKDRYEKLAQEQNQFLKTQTEQIATIEAKSKKCSELSKIIEAKTAEKNRIPIFLHGQKGTTESIEKSFNALDTKKKELDKKLSNIVKELGFSMALFPLREKIQDTIRLEIGIDEWKRQKEITEQKSAHIIETALPENQLDIVDPPLTESQWTKLREMLAKAITLFYSPEPADKGTGIFDFLNLDEKRSLLDRQNQMSLSSLKGIAQIVDESNICAKDMETLNRQLRKLAGEDHDSQMKRYEILTNDLEKLAKEHGNEEAELKRTQKEKIDTDSEITKINAKLKEIYPYKVRIEVAEKINCAIEAARPHLLELCKSNLMEIFAENLRKIMDPKYKEFMPKLTDRGIVLVKNQERLEPENYCSAGQQRAFGLAYSLTLGQMSGSLLPLVIDSPLGNLDEEHRKRVLDALSRHNGQVIFLSHDNEIHGHYHDRIEDRILKQFLLRAEPVAEGITKTIVLEDCYF